MLSMDNKALLKILAVLFFTVLLGYQLPHDSYSFIEYVIPPINLGSSTIYFSGLIPIIVVLVAINKLHKLERFADTNKFVMFLVLIFLVMPIMKSTLDVVKASYFWAVDDELYSVNYVDSSIQSINIIDDKVTLKVNLELIDYGRSESEFTVRMHLPDSLNNALEKKYLEFGEWYYTAGNRSIVQIEREFLLQLARGKTAEDILNSRWYYEDLTYEIHNEKDSLIITYHGLTL